jgi:hypothetical protein
LAWRASKDWMDGKQVLLFYNNSSEVRDAILNEIVKDDLMNVATVSLLLKPCGTRNNSNKFVDEDFINNAHCVINLNWKDSDDFAISFFLPVNHGLGKMTKLIVIDAHQKKICYSTYLTSQWMQHKKVINPKSRQLLSVDDSSSSVSDNYCKETEDEYKLRFCINRENYQTPNGN